MNNSERKDMQQKALNYLHKDADSLREKHIHEKQLRREELSALMKQTEEQLRKRLFSVFYNSSDLKQLILLWRQEKPSPEKIAVVIHELETSIIIFQEKVEEFPDLKTRSRIFVQYLRGLINCIKTPWIQD